VERWVGGACIGFDDLRVPVLGLGGWTKDSIADSLFPRKLFGVKVHATHKCTRQRVRVVTDLRRHVGDPFSPFLGGLERLDYIVYCILQSVQTFWGNV
jgi:hypothetical protein